MALFKCSLCICSLLAVGVAGVEAKLSVPNGAGPFSIGVSVNPLAKVIEMLNNIKDQVQEEHKDEAAIYENFACFCKDKTERLVIHVHHHKKQIDKDSATIGDRTAQSHNLRSDREKRTSNLERFSTQLDDNTQRLKEENANWENIEALFNNNQQLVTDALKSLKDSKTAVSSAAFLQMPGIAKLKREMQIGAVMGSFKAPKQKAIAASFLQGAAHADPQDMESYGYHSGSDDVIDLVEDMMGQMRDIHNQQETEHVKAVASFKGMVESLRNKIAENKDTIHDIKHSEAKMKTEIAESRQALIENNHDLVDSDKVLKEVTAACESRAEEYTKRTEARKAELTALNAAMACLSSAHAGAKSQAESLLQATPILKLKSLPAPNHIETSDVKGKAAEKVGAEVKPGTKPLSFLQELGKASFLGRTELSSDERKKKALDVILSAGKRVNSLMLKQVIATHGDDPFAKVKHLLLDLRWRLEKEEHGEVDKHVWCTRSVNLAEHERDTRFEEAKTLSMEVSQFDATIDKLKVAIKDLDDKAREIGESITQIYTDVAQLSREQIKTMMVQKKARDDIRQAILILRSYYSGAAFLQASAGEAFLQASDPDDAQTLKDYRKERQDIRDENARRAEGEEGREGERSKAARNRIGDLEGDTPSLGRAGSLGDAVALMETIADDFDREMGNIQGDLDKEHQQLVLTNSVLQAQKEHAEELRDLDKMDLKRATIKRNTKFSDMQTAMDLLDLALKELEELKPTCIDTGMSYSERVEKRKIEMEALAKALCILGETAEKYGCPDV